MCARIRRRASLAAATVLWTVLGQSVAGAESWAQVDVGAVAVAGSASIGSKNGRIKVSGEGTGIGSEGDGFHYLYQQLAADGTMVVRGVSLQNTSPWAQSGIMFRQALTPGSIHASLLVTPSNGILFQRRTTVGGPTATTAIAGGTPCWLRISRQGTTIAGATSADGVKWTSAMIASVPFTGSIYVGLAVTSRRPSRLANAAFDSMALSDAATPANGGTDATPPSVVVTSPAGGSTASGTITVAAAAADDVGVASVQLLVNGSALGAPLTDAPYALSWNTAAVANGNYVVTAVAGDVSGNTTVSVPVFVTVNNVTTPSAPRLVEFNSPDHNTVASTGEPTVTGYTLEIWHAGTATAGSQPYRTADLGKPSSTTTLISVDEQAFFALLPKGQEYFTTILAIGPGGSSRSTASDVFLIQ